MLLTWSLGDPVRVVRASCRRSATASRLSEVPVVPILRVQLAGFVGILLAAISRMVEPVSRRAYPVYLPVLSRRNVSGCYMTIIESSS